MSFFWIAVRASALALLALTISSCGGGSHSSEPVTATPVFSEIGGSYVGPQSITITDSSTGATIYYTVDGTTPTASSTKYTGTAIAVSTTLVLQAIAVSTGNSNSAVASAAYIIAPASVPTAGVWYGTDADSGANVIAMINAAGVAEFVRGDYAQFSGTLKVTQSAITATLAGYANFPNTFADGTSSGSGALTATVEQQFEISGSLAFKSSSGTAYPLDFQLGYVTTNPTGSALSDVAGSYSDGNSNGPNVGATVTISGTGAIASTGASTGCIMTGTIGTADATTDVYEVSYTYSGCTGTYSVLNGQALSGLAALNAAVSPTQLLMAVNGPASGSPVYGLVASLLLN